MSAYHAIELAVTGLAVAGCAAFVLRGWWAKWRGRAARAAAAGCASCNDCGSCSPTAVPREQPIRWMGPRASKQL